MSHESHVCFRWCAFGSCQGWLLYLSLRMLAENIPSPPPIAMCHFHLKFTGHVTRDTFAMYLYMDTFEKLPHESIKTFEPCLRRFSKLRHFRQGRNSTPSLTLRGAESVQVGGVTTTACTIARDDGLVLGPAFAMTDVRLPRLPLLRWPGQNVGPLEASPLKTACFTATRVCTVNRLCGKTQLRLPAL